MIRKSPERIALFAGSFRPFTVGHASIVERGLGLFDSVVIAVGHNAAKPDSVDEAEAICRQIERFYAAEPRVKVVRYSGLTTDEAKRQGACCLLRGVRSTKDFEYERDMADINRNLSGLETVLLYSLPELSAVSSSVVRELQSLGCDVSAYLPVEVKSSENQ